MNERFEETPTSVIFKRTNKIFHRSFIRTYQMRTIPEIRRKASKFWGNAQQDEIIHYLKEKGLTIQN